MRKQEIKEICTPLSKDKKVSILLNYINDGWQSYDLKSLIECTRDIEHDHLKIELKKARRLNKPDVVDLLLQNDKLNLMNKDDNELVDEIFSFHEYEGGSKFKTYLSQAA